MNRLHLPRTLLALAAGVLLLAGPLSGKAMAAPDRADVHQVFNRDVFVIVGSTLRNPDANTDPGAQLFNVAGVALESSPGHFLTWGEWSGASATSTARTIGGPNGRRTDARLELTGLVPGGLYSVFYGTLGPDSEQPLCPNVERTLPLDAVHPERQEPERNSFVAGADGSAEFRGQVDGALLDSTQVFFSIVYHFSGRTAYPFPNLGEQQTQGENCRSSFGEDAMRHVLILQKW